ncbi:hypothetical protein HDU97_002301 [Phlyctochytrium planicorne]|nr:hypothetical protein HDU97_002301 [Phlyctochytrium planicorne]
MKTNIGLASFVSQYVRAVSEDSTKREVIFGRLRAGAYFRDDAFGAVILIDISGYSKLTSALASYGKISSELVTINVRTFLNQIIEVVVRYGGDVVRFLGDALLVVFREREQSLTPRTIDNALRCCLDVMIHHPSHTVKIASLSHVVSAPQAGLKLSKTVEAPASQTITRKNSRGGSGEDQAYCLRLHIAAVAGKICDYILGTEGRMDHVVYGSCFEMLDCLLSAAKQDEIAVSNTLLDVVAFHSPNFSASLLQFARKTNNGVVISNGLNHLRGLLDNFLPAKSTTISTFTGITEILSIDQQSFLERFVNASIVSQHLQSAKRQDDSGSMICDDEIRDFSQFREITVLFIQLLESFEPNIAQFAIERLLKALQSSEGVFQQFAVDDKGQTLLACFGLPPWTHDNDPGRALAAAFQFKSTFQECPFVISVATGTILFTRLGNWKRSEASLLGDVVNQAARLLGVASIEHPIVCDTETSKRDTSFAKSCLGDFKLKGNINYVEVWSVDSEKPIDSEDYITKNVGKIFGYIEERTRIRDGVQRWESREELLSILVEGPSGIGKSTLLEYFQQLIAEVNTSRICVTRLVLDNQFVPYSGIQNTMAFVFRHAFQSGFCKEFKSIDMSWTSVSVFEYDDDEVVGQLSDFLGFLHVDLKYLPLLGIFFRFNKIAENDYSACLSPEARNIATSAIASKILAEWARRSSTVFVFDDIQWLDSLSLAILRQLLKEEGKDQNDELQTFVSDLRGFHVMLQGFNMSDVTDYLLDIYKSKGATSQDCLKVNGSGTLVCSSVADFESFVEHSVNNSVMIQFDQLSNDFQNLLRRASIFGHYFSLDELLIIMGSNNDYDVLRNLIRNDDSFKFIRAADGNHEERLFHFRHVAICNAIYESLAYSQKSSWHEAVGRRLQEKMAIVPLSILLPSLYHHFSQTSLVEERIKYGELLGMEYYKNSYKVQAMEIFKQHIDYIDSLSSLPKEFNDKKRIALWLSSLADVAKGPCNESLVTNSAIRALALLGVKFPFPSKASLSNVIGAAFRQWWRFQQTRGGRRHLGREKVDIEAVMMIDKSLQSLFWIAIPQSNKKIKLLILLELLNNSIRAGLERPALWAARSGASAFFSYLPLRKLSRVYHSASNDAWKRAPKDMLHLSISSYAAVHIREGYDVGELLDFLENAYEQKGDIVSVQYARSLKVIYRHPLSFKEIQNLLDNMNEVISIDLATKRLQKSLGAYKIPFVVINIWKGFLEQDLKNILAAFCELGLIGELLEYPFSEFDAVALGISSIWVILSMIDKEAGNGLMQAQNAALKGISSVLKLLKGKLKSTSLSGFYQPFLVAAQWAIKRNTPKAKAGLKNILQAKHSIVELADPWAVGMCHASIWLLDVDEQRTILKGSVPSILKTASKRVESRGSPGNPQEGLSSLQIPAQSNQTTGDKPLPSIPPRLSSTDEPKTASKQIVEDTSKVDDYRSPLSPTSPKTPLTSRALEKGAAYFSSIVGKSSQGSASSWVKSAFGKSGSGQKDEGSPQTPPRSHRKTPSSSSEDNIAFAQTQIQSVTSSRQPNSTILRPFASEKPQASRSDSSLNLRREVGIPSVKPKAAQTPYKSNPSSRFHVRPPPSARPLGMDMGNNTPWDVDVETSKSKAQLRIKVVEARNLLVRSPAAKPYCVVEFEKNEFVTKEAIAIAEGTQPPSVLHQFLSESNGNGSGDQMDITPDGDKSSAGFCPVWKHEATFDVARPDGEVTITIWDRAGAVPGEGECFLGMMKIRPPRINGKMHDNWFRLLPRQWKEKVKGDIRIQLMYQAVESRPLGANDFELLKVVGKGSFGKVLQVRKKDTGRIYAMKVLVKKDIVERQEIAHTLSERNVLIQATSPFLVGLKFSFQTPEKLYLVLDYMNGGELFYHLQKETAFSEDRAKFYTCELISALQHLHKYNIVYRDLKPENILLDSNGHISLTDFGLCKENLSFDDTTNTFCGTAEYLAPEVLTGQGYGKAVDWWSLGILFYEMTTGLPPFYSENVNLMYKKILHNELLFPPGFSEKAQDLVRGLLERDPKKRLGAGPEDAEDIKRHRYFSDVDWEKLLKKQVKPPFKPKVESEMDTSNFDPVFTDNMMPVDSLPNNSAPLSETIQQNFKGFTYTDESAHLAESIQSYRSNRTFDRSSVQFDSNIVDSGVKGASLDQVPSPEHDGTSPNEQNQV